tara:strand:- start:58 stop:480 length:423 start_codon:yes stop_codon:yes gene_type:complete
MARRKKGKIALFISLTLLISTFVYFLAYLFGLIPTFDINIFFGLCFVLLITLVATQIAKRNRLGRRQQISGDVRHAVYVRDNYRCRMCGKGDEDYDLQIDHIKPVSKGGTNHIHNLQTLCEDCNKEKGNKYKGKGHSYRD